MAGELGPAAEECCCSYNMMKLTRHLFGQQPDAKFFDYYERLLMNVRHGTQDRNGMLMNYVPLQPGMFKTFGTLFDSFWCCTGTGSEEYSKLNDSIYFHSDDSVFVNLFIPSTLNWRERGLKLRQETRFPHDERITFTIDSAPANRTALKVRVPYWATNGVTITINGEAQNVAAIPSSYFTLTHDWKSGDKVAIDLPLALHVAVAPDDKQVQAAMYGPLVLAARLGIEGLTTTMIYGGYGPRDDGYPMPEIDTRHGLHGGSNGEPPAPTAGPEDVNNQFGVTFDFKGCGGSGLMVGGFCTVDWLGGFKIDITATKTRTKANAFGLNVVVTGEPALLGGWDATRQTYAPGPIPGKVASYRFNTFYLPPNSDNGSVLISEIVDRTWLRSNEPDAVTLRTANTANPAWRVLHRVTYVNRIPPGPDNQPNQALAAPVAQLIDRDANEKLIDLILSELGPNQPTQPNIGAAVAKVINPRGQEANYPPSRLVTLVPWWDDFLDTTRGDKPNQANFELLQRLQLDVLKYVLAGFADGTFPWEKDV
jgi:hypothetical protein